MKLLTVMVTFNRLAYTKKTLKNYLSTVDVPNFLVVVDNNSTDGTREWLEQQRDKGKINYLILNDENTYPGKATNKGWETGLYYYPEATHLMRLDNDMNLSEDWCEIADKYFNTIPKLGQLGLDFGPLEDYDCKYAVEEHNGLTINPFPGNVGGTNIITRKVYEDGLRYDETPWNHSIEEPTPQEDSKFSQAIARAGYLFGHSTTKIGWTIDEWEDYPEYYIKTLTDRGYSQTLKTRLKELKELADGKRSTTKSE